VPKEAKQSYNNPVLGTESVMKVKNISQSPNKQRDVANTYGNQKENTLF